MDVDPPGAGPVLDNAQLARLRPTLFGEVVQFAETTSTNSELIERAAGGARAGLVVVADYQTAGRGRFDRRWESPPGKSLLFSVLLRPGEEELPAPRRHLAVAAVSLALVDGAKAVAGAEVQLKWPNDLVVGDLKLAGVLAESASDGSLVVGAGVNVGWAPDGLAGDVPERRLRPSGRPRRAPGGVAPGSGPALRSLGPGEPALPHGVRHRRPSGHRPAGGHGPTTARPGRRRRRAGPAGGAGRPTVRRSRWPPAM